MAKESVDWKAKYKEAALELERLESSHQTDQLRSAIGYLSLGVHGLSSELDLALDKLQQRVKAGEPIPRSLLNQVETAIRSLDREREEASQALLSRLREWVLQLKSTVEPGSDQADKLIELELGAQEVVEQSHRLPDWLAQLLKLQGHCMSALQSATPAPASLQQAQKQSAAVNLSLIQSELVQLIQTLNLGADTRPQGLALIEEVQNQLTLETLGDLFRRVVELAQQVSQNSNAEFQTYLVNLHSQLSEVQSFIEASRKEQLVAGDAQRQLDQQLRTDVENIHQAVEETQELSELKLSVATQLEGIVRAMDEFKRVGEQRDDRLQERYDALMVRVAEMEGETSRIKAHMEAERQKARTDALTGLPNRASYDDYIARELERWARYHQVFSVAVGDLDHFKQVNDSYGHLVGDKVLRLVAKLLTKNLRTSDFIARFGGEEFVILMPSTQVEAASTAVDKLRLAIGSSPFNFRGEPVTISMSFGVTQIAESDTLESLFERADAALYRAKQQGRNQVCTG